MIFHKRYKLIQGYKLDFNDIGHKWLAACPALKIRLKSRDWQYHGMLTDIIELYCAGNQGIAEKGCR